MKLKSTLLLLTVLLSACGSNPDNNNQGSTVPSGQSSTGDSSSNGQCDINRVPKNGPKFADPSNTKYRCQDLTTGKLAYVAFYENGKVLIKDFTTNDDREFNPSIDPNCYVNLYSQDKGTLDYDIYGFKFSPQNTLEGVSILQIGFLQHDLTNCEVGNF